MDQTIPSIFLNLGKINIYVDFIFHQPLQAIPKEQALIRYYLKSWNLTLLNSHLTILS